MKRVLSFLFIFLVSYSVLCAQDDYVISKPDPLLQKKNPKVYREITNPDFTNYFLTPTAFTLKENDLRASNTDIVFAKASVGIANNSMVSINVSLFGTATASIKHKIELSESLALAGTLSAGSLLSNGRDSTIFFGGGSILGTYGDIQNNFSAGIGLYYAASKFDIINDDSNLAFYHVFIGLQKQISKRLYLVFDGMYFFDYQFYTGGIGIKVVLYDNISINGGIMPLAVNEPTSAGSRDIESTFIPIISFRMLLN